MVCRSHEQFWLPVGLERMVSGGPIFLVGKLNSWNSWYRVPDLSLPAQHPKRAFIRRVVEFEIRLAYHERVFKTLPPEMQDPEACVISGQAPAAAFDYEDPCK